MFRLNLIVGLIVYLFILASSSAEATSVDAGCERTRSDPLKETRDEINLNHVGASTFARLEQYLHFHRKDVEAHALLAQCYERNGLDGLADQEISLTFILNPKRKYELLASFKTKFASLNPASSFEDWLRIHSDFSADEDVKFMAKLVNQLYGSAASAKDLYIDGLREVGRANAMQRINAELSRLESKRGNFNRALALCQNQSQTNTAEECLLAKTIALNGLHKYREALHLAQTLHNACLIGADKQMALAYKGLGDFDSALSPALINLLISRSPADRNEDTQLVASIIKKISPTKLVAATKPALDYCKKMQNSERFESEFIRCCRVAGIKRT